MNPQPEHLGQPCRNFQFMAMDTIRDPKDGREKVVLSNFASGARGNLVLVDPATGAGEVLPLPGDSGGEGLLNLDNQKLLVGTSEQFGYLHSLDLKTRTWAEPLRDPNETYIWNLCRGDDGLIYCGTYPGCVLLRYDPTRHTLENLGRVSDDPANHYSRYVYGGIPGHILIACWMNTVHLSLWNIAERRWRPFGKPGASVREITREFICTDTNGALEFYDIHTLELIQANLSGKLTPSEPSPFRGSCSLAKLSDGGIFGVRGQEYFHIRQRGATPELKAVPAPRPATCIHTLTSDPQGKIWGASAFGQTIFSLDPLTGRAWNSEVLCDTGGEAYGMRFARGKLFLSCYWGGDHVVYDPTQSWDQIHNVNPRTLQTVGPELIRPASGSVIGPDGHFWTGWWAQYGVYGGGLSRVNVETFEVTSWRDPIPRQAVNGLAADERYLYFTTCGIGNGLPSAPGPFHFVVWEASVRSRETSTQRGRTVCDILCAPSDNPCAMAAIGGRGLVRFGNDLRIFNSAAMAFEEGSVPFDDWPRAAVPLAPDRVAVFTGKRVWWLNPATRQIEAACEIPNGPSAATATPDGTLYFAIGPDLYRLSAPTRPRPGGRDLAPAGPLPSAPARPRPGGRA